MAVYRVQGPDGAIHRFEGPDDATPEQVEAAAAQQFGSVRNNEVAPTDNVAPKGLPRLTQGLGRMGEDIARGAVAAIEGAGQGALNVGGIVGERVAPGYEEARAARAAASPGAATAGYLAGAAAGGGAVGKGLSLAGRGIAAALGRTAAARLPAGAGVLRKGATAVGMGAAAGGAQAGAEGEDIGTGAALGGVAGPVAAGGARAAQGIARAVRTAAGPSGKAISAARILGKRFKLTPEEMQQALDNFQVQAGRPAALSDIEDLYARGALREFARENPAFGAEVAREVERRATQAPQGVTRAQAQAADLSTATTIRKETMDAAMAPFEAKRVPLPKSALDALSEPDVYESLPRSLRRKITDAVDNGKPLTIRDLENLRQEFRSRVAPGEKMRFREYADDIEKLASRAEPRYGAALDEYRRNSNLIDAFEHGLKGKSLTDVQDEGLKKALSSPEGRQGYALGTVERRAAANLETVAPDYVQPQEAVGAPERAHAAIAVATGGGPSRAYHVLRAIPRIRASDKVLRLAAKYYYEPGMAGKAVAILRKSGANDADLRDIAAALGGAAAGGAQ